MVPISYVMDMQSYTVSLNYGYCSLFVYCNTISIVYATDILRSVLLILGLYVPSHELSIDNYAALGSTN